jgi:formylglycine-generating enzyme required for sulfatase activity
VEEFHRELASRVRAPVRDKAAILQVTNAIQATGRQRDIPLLDELRRELNGVSRLLEARLDIARLIAEAGDSPEKAGVLTAILDEARDDLSPVRLIALRELARAARRGHEPTRRALDHIADSKQLSRGDRQQIEAMLAAPSEPAAAGMQAAPEAVGAQTPADIAKAERAVARAVRARRRRVDNALEWVGLALFAALGSALIYTWQHPTPLNSDADIVVVDRPSNAAPAPAAPQQQFVFRDCEGCPEMMRLDAGVFWMGARESDSGRRPWESPLHEVTLAPFAIGVHEVTFAEWDACVASGGCGRYEPPDRGWGRGQRPVMMVSWRDAQRYLRWLTERSGHAYRLPTEAEWEYAARGGSDTQFWYGDAFSPERTPSGGKVEVQDAAANGFGLRGVTGNVAEWVEDCYVNSYVSAPADGRAVTGGDCARRVLRGGSWRDGATGLRIANRSRIGQTVRDAGIGFRVARSD